MTFDMLFVSRPNFGVPHPFAHFSTKEVVIYFLLHTSSADPFLVSFDVDFEHFLFIYD